MISQKRIEDATEALREARDEIKCLNRMLENKSKEIGRSEHRGNTVDYIYDKLENYSRQLGEVGAKNRELKSKLKIAVEALEFIAVPGAPRTKEDWEIKCARSALAKIKGEAT